MIILSGGYELSILNYKLKWNYYNSKIAPFEKQQGWVIYKEIYISVSDKRYIITKKKLGNRYRCKVWTGRNWMPFACKKTPRDAMNVIKKYNSEEYLQLV